MQKIVRKVNYMEIKTVNWDQHGYKHLGLTRLISCDQAACVEKSSENSQRVGRRQLDREEIYTKYNCNQRKYSRRTKCKSGRSSSNELA